MAEDLKVSSVKVEGELKKAVLSAVGELGGFGKFIKAGDIVMLKPNFNTADPYPASTDFEFLKIMVELAYEHGAKLVMIGESSTMSLNTRKVMEKLKIFDLEKMEPPPRIYVFDEGKWTKKQVPDCKHLTRVSIPEILDRVDKLILLPCLKTHSMAQFTGALKLSVGFTRPFRRMSLHANHLQEKIAELNKLINPALVIMDGRKCFINKGPSGGEICEPDLILASENRVAIDIQGIKIIQSYEGNSLKDMNAEEIPQIKRAKEMEI